LQDGEIPSPTDPKRHVDSLEYRLGAIRECFEESGILLAKRNDGSGALLEVPEEEREKARKDIHSGKVRFSDWVKSQGGIVDSGMFCRVRWSRVLIGSRFFDTVYSLGYACKYTETIYDTDVHILSPSYADVREKHFF
jgi:hypothetical protein